MKSQAAATCLSNWPAARLRTIQRGTEKPGGSQILSLSRFQPPLQNVCHQQVGNVQQGRQQCLPSRTFSP